MRLNRRKFLTTAAGIWLMTLVERDLLAEWLAQLPGPEAFAGPLSRAQETLNPRTLIELLGQDTSQKPAAKPGSKESAPRQALPPRFDCILRGGTIIDGTGKPGFKGDVAIAGDRIGGIGDLGPAQAARVIDASGLTITPGFIDLHTHNENYMLCDGRAEMVLLQGVTTQIGSNCGRSVSSIGGYFDVLGPIGVNFGLLAGYANLRESVIGGANRKATPREVFALQDELALAMRQGAFGMSVGLAYRPQTMATTEELVELCKVMKDYGGYYSTHVRDEQDQVVSAVREAIEIGFRTGIPVQYSHVKTMARRNWSKMGQVLGLVEEARGEGLDIAGDVYAYTFTSSDLGTSRESISESNMEMVLQHPLMMVGSDSVLEADGTSGHPRTFGNYSRILSRYVRERRVLNLENAIQKMTSMPAARLGLNDRGLLAPLYKADLAIFDFNGVREQATRARPGQVSSGMVYVMVNGRLAVEKGQPTGVLAGVPLKHFRRGLST